MSLYIPDDVINELYVRFILNLPKTTKNTFSEYNVRIFFEIEYAHWFYLDNFCAERNLPYLNMYDFTYTFFQKFPDILPPNVDWKVEFDEWRRYKATTPTCGAIILSSDSKMILLVKGFHNKRWSFPGGKVNEGESCEKCTIREVLEETGLEIAAYLVPDLYIEFDVSNTPRRQYIIEGMPLHTELQPMTKNEIEAITWFNIVDLPMDNSSKSLVEKLQLKSAEFFVVTPYMKQLQIYLDYRKRGFPQLDALSEAAREVNTKKNRSRKKSDEYKESDAASRNAERELFRQKNMAMYSDDPSAFNDLFGFTPSPSVSPHNKETKRKKSRTPSKTSNPQKSTSSRGPAMAPRVVESNLMILGRGRGLINMRPIVKQSNASGEELLAVIQGRNPRTSPQFPNHFQAIASPHTAPPGQSGSQIPPAESQLPHVEASSVVLPSKSRGRGLVSHRKQPTHSPFPGTTSSLLLYLDDSDGEAAVDERGDFSCKAWTNVHVNQPALVNEFTRFDFS